MVSVRERAVAAGMSPERVTLHWENKVLLLDGEVVSDLDQPAPPGTRLAISGA
ncbi:hypothetical protein EV383_2423 [Pseudonocardia sediminis]|uniref:Uncharacterized protein n=1 Tax=Pseudonocardia sediminis TaxID=1397368 RepID=A0A4V2FQQ1_PSEST|nr:hypothetical protein EV383_2423 [Pseudonocardia sediminis]